MIRKFNNRQVQVLFLCSALFAGCSSSSSDDLVGNWSKRSPFGGTARSEAATFSIGDKAYVYGGYSNYNGTKRYNNLWEYDASQDFWTQKAKLDTLIVSGETTVVSPRSSASAFSAAGKGYVGLGYNGTDYLKDFYQYDPTTNTWKRIKDFGGTARTNAIAFGLYDQGYVGTGYDGNNLSDIFRYDPASDSWTEISTKLEKRQLASVFVIDDKAYIGLGSSNSSYLTDFWRFDPKGSTVNDQWTSLHALQAISDESFDDEYGTIPRNSAVSFVINNKGYITAGEYSSLLTTTWEYNPLTDRWIKKTAFEGAARMGAVGITAGGKGFLATGRSSSLSFDDLWEFKPDDVYDENN